MPKIIAIGGVSRSGKTSLAFWLHQQLPKSMVLSQDNFVFPEHMIPQIKERTDWENPNSIDWSAWKKAIDSNIPDCEYLILEGLFAFQEQAQPIPVTYQYYLSIDREEFLEEREKEQRWGYEPLWFIEHVWKSHFVYGLPAPSHNATKYHNISAADYQQILDQVTS
ncbi:MAG: hypothetical protein HEP71_34940 [Roseivirga sp.]|nr:hypothetical protein [Roseivirga sp.]